MQHPALVSQDSMACATCTLFSRHLSSSPFCPPRPLYHSVFVLLLPLPRFFFRFRCLCVVFVCMALCRVVFIGASVLFCLFCCVLCRTAWCCFNILDNKNTDMYQHIFVRTSWVFWRRQKREWKSSLLCRRRVLTSPHLEILQTLGPETHQVFRWMTRTGHGSTSFITQ